MLMPMLWTNDVDDLMDNMAQSWNNLDRMMNEAFGNVSDNGMMGMKTDVIDEDKDYKLEADLPGFDKSDIHMDLKNGILNITASHKENKDEKDQKTGRYLRRERREASYERSFNVGDEVKPEEINAQYENGVLTVTIPKKAEQIEQKEAPKAIEVH